MALNIKLKKSLIGSTKRQIAVAESLGLKKPGDCSTQPDSPATQGKIKKLSHLVEVVNE